MGPGLFHRDRASSSWWTHCCYKLGPASLSTPLGKDGTVLRPQKTDTTSLHCPAASAAVPWPGLPSLPAPQSLASLVAQEAPTRQSPSLPALGGTPWLWGRGGSCLRSPWQSPSSRACCPGAGSLTPGPFRGQDAPAGLGYLRGGSFGLPGVRRLAWECAQCLRIFPFFKRS